METPRQEPALNVVAQGLALGRAPISGVFEPTQLRSAPKSKQEDRDQSHVRRSSNVPHVGVPQFAQDGSNVRRTRTQYIDLSEEAVCTGWRNRDERHVT